MSRLVVFFGSGVMAGVFSAGAAIRLMEADIYGRLDAVYGTSVGVFNGAYFLTEQPEARHGYFDELTDGFIQGGNIPGAFAEHIYSRYVTNIPVSERRDAVDLDYLIDIHKEKRPLDVDKLAERDIPLYARLLNVDTWSVERPVLGDHDHPFRVMKAACSLLPYYSPAPRINGERYMDAGVKDPIGLEYMLDAHPDAHILLVLNYEPETPWKYRVKNAVEGFIGETLHDGMLSAYLEKQPSLRRDIKRARELDRVTLVTPSMSCSIGEDDASVLREMYRDGRSQVRPFLNAVGEES